LLEGDRQVSVSNIILSHRAGLWRSLASKRKKIEGLQVKIVTIKENKMQDKPGTRTLDKLIWMALTDAVFCDGLLNGRRREILDALELTEMERETVLAVQANTLESFAGALYQNCTQYSGI
jgi:hypothetical protein